MGRKKGELTHGIREAREISDKASDYRFKRTIQMRNLDWLCGHNTNCIHLHKLLVSIT